MKNILKKLILNYEIFKNILEISNKKIKIIFYSEEKSYQKFSYELINFFANKYPNQVYYVSSDLNDKIDSSKVKNFYIGDGFLMIFFFSILKAEFFFLTITDLGNNVIKKNKNIDKYIYFNHSGSSTFRGYTEGAFDNYDIIFCNGQYQVDEIRFRENKKKLPKKNLILTGYFYFDYMLKKINIKIPPNEILIAPTWSYIYKNFINEKFVIIIERLLSKNYKVIFRPHPEHLKRSKHILKIIKSKYNSNKNFFFDTSSENIKSMEKAKCLITDISDIALEYMLIFKRPVLYLKFDNVKVHNKRFSDFDNFVSIETKFKDEFGVEFSDNEIENIDQLVEVSIVNFSSKLDMLNRLKKFYYFNFGNVMSEFEKIWEEKILK